MKPYYEQTKAITFLRRYHILDKRSQHYYLFKFRIFVVTSYDLAQFFMKDMNDNEI